MCAQAIVRDNMASMVDKGFTIGHAVQMVSHSGGSKNLAAMLDNYAALRGT